MNLMTIVYFIGALLILGVIVVAHEFGHFIAARLLKIPVLEFAIGFGPKLIGWERNGTLFTIRPIPMGGFCKYVGEDDGDFASPDALGNQKPWKKFLTILAGPLMNFILGYLVVIIMLTLYGFPAWGVLIDSVEPDSPAAQVELMKGDAILSIGGEKIEVSNEGVQRMTQIIQERPGESVALRILRDEKELELQVVPRPAEDGSARIGVSIGIGQVILHASFSQAISMSGEQIKYYSTVMIVALRDLIFKGEGLEDTAGPVGMLSVMTEQIQRSWDSIFNLIVIISLNLGIVNLLPLPALDGGRLVFIALEGIRRKPLKPELEGMVHAVGFLLLIGVMLFFTYKDILRLVGGA